MLILKLIFKNVYTILKLIFSNVIFFLEIQQHHYRNKKDDRHARAFNDRTS